ncbi:MAG: hypothetical protein PHC75_09890 [Burkholderiales bacterium]|nr:hypothetical protein [Burkholderiales bacterium]
MKLNNIIRLQRQLSIIEILSIVLPAILIFDFMIDCKLDYAIVITEILIHSHITHLIPANILCYIIITTMYTISNSLSIIGTIEFSTVYFIYNIVVNIICIASIFYFIDHRKLTSRFSTIHFDTLFNHHKEVYKALVSIP